MASPITSLEQVEHGNTPPQKQLFHSVTNQNNYLNLRQQTHTIIVMTNKFLDYLHKLF